MIQFFAVHSVATQLCFLPIYARVHLFAKTVLYVFVEVLKRTLPGVIIFVRKKYFHSQYGYFHTACVACYTLHIQWFIFRTILLSGDVETNPGPETLTFCCWNLNSITAYDFLIVETHFDSTVDEDRLALDGYSFYNDNHPQNVKRGGVGLYIKDSLPSKHRLDLVTLPECVVCEIQLNRKKIFLR